MTLIQFTWFLHTDWGRFSVYMFFSPFNIFLGLNLKVSTSVHLWTAFTSQYRLWLQDTKVANNNARSHCSCFFVCKIILHQRKYSCINMWQGFKWRGQRTTDEQGTNGVLWWPLRCTSKAKSCWETYKTFLYKHFFYSFARLNEPSMIQMCCKYTHTHTDSYFCQDFHRHNALPSSLPIPLNLIFALTKTGWLTSNLKQRLNIQAKLCGPTTQPRLVSRMKIYWYPLRNKHHVNTWTGHLGEGVQICWCVPLRKKSLSHHKRGTKKPQSTDTATCS